MKKEQAVKNFLVNRDETGREIVQYLDTGKKYYVEWIDERDVKTSWGDIDPATKTLQTGNYGKKYKGSICPGESIITEENGFEHIIEGKGSPYSVIDKLHEQWKKDNGFNGNTDNYMPKQIQKIG